VGSRVAVCRGALLLHGQTIAGHKRSLLVADALALRSAAGVRAVHTRARVRVNAGVDVAAVRRARPRVRARRRTLLSSKSGRKSRGAAAGGAGGRRRVERGRRLRPIGLGRGGGQALTCRAPLSTAGDGRDGARCEATAAGAAREEAKNLDGSMPTLVMEEDAVAGASRRGFDSVAARLVVAALAGESAGKGAAFRGSPAAGEGGATRSSSLSSSRMPSSCYGHMDRGVVSVSVRPCARHEVDCSPSRRTGCLASDGEISSHKPSHGSQHARILQGRY
jgi:hypothetical protein